MLSHRENVDSILSLRTWFVGIVDLIKPPIDPRILPGTQIFQDLLGWAVRGERQVDAWLM
jgi:hypothetical protein